MKVLMAKLDLHLPPHCQLKKRKGYTDVYFMVHPKDRPDNWPATIHLGRTDKASTEEINQKASDIYHEYLKFKDMAVTGNDYSIKSGCFPDIISRYKASPYWSDLSERTKKDYETFFANIKDWSFRAGNPHVKYLTAKSIVKWLNTFDASPRRQKYAKSVMSILLGAAIREGYIETNLMRDIKLRRRKIDKRPIIIWEDEDVEKFVLTADNFGNPSIGTAVLIAYETAQRPSDVLNLQKPRDYREGKFRIKQSKTGKEVRIEATKRLRQRLDRIPNSQLMLVCNEKTGGAWKTNWFSRKFREICIECELDNHMFAQLRHSAVLHLERAGNSISQIAAVTGHSRKTVKDMIDNHYGIDRDEKMAHEAIKNLEQYRKKMQSQTK